MSCQIVAGKGESMKTLKPNGLAILGAKQGQFPKRAISLLEIMREFSAYKIHQWFEIIDCIKEQATKPIGAVFTKRQMQKLLRNLVEGDDLDNIFSSVESITDCMVSPNGGGCRPAP